MYDRFIVKFFSQNSADSRESGRRMSDLLEGADHGGAEYWTEEMCSLAHE